MSDKEMLEIASFLAAGFCVVIAISLVPSFIARATRNVADRIRCNVACFFAAPLVLLALKFLFVALKFVLSARFDFGGIILYGLCLLTPIGLIFGGLAALIAGATWRERQIGLSFLLSAAAMYALLFLATGGNSGT